ncbi:MAG: hypothetical protein JSS56_07495, partial [Proteobacteria bacterium]|nr:hypothetical protein [Pseudomonadota bacterium]
MKHLAAGVLMALACAAASAQPRQTCELDGRPVQLTDPASTAGKSGVLRCKDPATGRVLRESTYDSGQELGLARTFHPDGKLRRAVFRAEPGGERAVAEFSARGQLTFLRCADKPLLDPAVDDKRLCGFNKTPSAVELFDDNGVLRSRLVYLNGRRQRAESLYDNGKVASVEETNGRQRIERQFSSAGVKRRETVSVALERGRLVQQQTLEYSERGWLVREQRWDPNGDPVRDDTYYTQNGQPKYKQAFSGNGSERVVDIVEYFENGQRSAEGRFSAPLHAPLLPVGLHRRFNDRGTVIAEMKYDGKGRLVDERRWDDAGQLLGR